MTWRSQAACQGKPVDWWFPSEHGSSTLAVHICRACPVQYECLEHALTSPERHGIWGGRSEKPPAVVDIESGLLC